MKSLRFYPVAIAVFSILYPTLQVQAGFRVIEAPQPASAAMPSTAPAAPVATAAALPPASVTNDALRSDNERLRVQVERLQAELDYLRVHRNYAQAYAAEPEKREIVSRDDAKFAEVQTRLDRLRVEFPLGSTAFAPAKDTAGALLVSAREAAKISVRGYTDSSGNAQINAAIARSRAQAVKTYMVARGIRPDRIEVAGVLGDYIAPNTSSVGRAMNRRVEIEFVELPKQIAMF